MPAIAYYSRDVLKASMVSISIISTSFILARAFAAVFGGYLVDKRPKLIILGALAMALNAPLVYLYSLTSSWIHIVGIKLVNGLLNGISWPLAQLAVAYASPKNTRARISALYFFFGSLASLAGNYLYAFTIGLGMRGQMIISGLFYILTGILMAVAYLLIGSIKREKKVEKREDIEVNPRTVMTFGAIISFISAFAFGEITYVYISETLGLEKGRVAMILGTISFISSLTSYFISWIADSLGSAKALKIIAVFGFLAPILAGIKTEFTIFLGIFLALLAVNSFRPISRKILVAHSRSSLAIGGINGIQNISAFLGGIIFGLAYTFGSLGIYYLAFLPYLPPSLGLIIVSRKLGK
ncbi:hypothetical protein CHITON_0621 [Thermococcus chitonophagus]|uniref:Major facilitator superfamily (MFS) profile domain-containing protein n=1 Tax=Thermococcus chitonophagus TaxID=54262 RepID=A0A160VRK4_9EURY|nr:hypothetical protein CHITON_0621 [Thermococcus chitonophagus]